MNDDTPRPAEHADLPPETDDEKKQRLAWEAEMIAEAEAELAAGLYVDGDEVLAWLESIGTDHELQPPPVRQR
jgi:hypothetical protein